MTDYAKPALPEPRMWYDHSTQQCRGMAPVGGTNEMLFETSDMQAYADACVAAALEHVKAEQDETPNLKCKSVRKRLIAQWESEDGVRPEPVAWMNVKYGTFFGAGVIAATDRNDDLIASGELIPLYAAPAAPAYVPLSPDDIQDSVHDAGLDWHRGWTTGDAPNRYEALCRAIESIVVARMRGEK